MDDMLALTPSGATMAIWTDLGKARTSPVWRRFEAQTRWQTLAGCDLDSDQLLVTLDEAGPTAWVLRGGASERLDRCGSLKVRRADLRTVVPTVWFILIAVLWIGYFVLEGGRLDSVFFFEGYWLYQVNSETGLARFVVSKEDGGRLLMGDPTASDRLILDGGIGERESAPSTAVTFRYVRPIRPEVLSQRFTILAHRGGGRTSDLIPHSENTVELVRIAVHYGSATALRSTCASPRTASPSSITTTP